MNSENVISKYLPKLVKETAEELIKMFEEKMSESMKSERRTKIIFPEYRAKEGNSSKIRVSEQELRFVMTSLLEKNDDIPNINYSVETPTEEKYSFSDSDSDSSKGRSAATDLTLYDVNEERLNIEMKAHASDKNSVKKDIEKILGEKYDGAWVHVLENEKENTVPVLFNKFKYAFKELSEENKGWNSQHKNKLISFYIIVLKTKRLLSKVMIDDKIEGFFDFDYLEKDDRKIRNQEIKGWRVEVLS